MTFGLSNFITFMKKIFLFVLFVSCSYSFVCLGQGAKPLFTNPFGVQMYTYRNSYARGMAAVLDTIKALGIKEVEGPNPNGITAEEFKKLLDERGLVVPSIGAGYDEIVKDPMNIVKQAKFFGANYVMVAWIGHGKTFTLEDAKKAVADFNAAGKVLAENGITFCYHDHGYEFGPYGDGTLLDYMIQNTDARYVQFEMDLMWTFHGGGDPAALLYKYPTRWKMLHLKDIRKGIANDITGGTDTNNDVALGTGQLNIPAILKAAKAIGIKHYFIEDESPNHAAQIPLTIGYIKGLKEE
jgi:sugar phosphate isomerase/epimerase